MLTIERRVKAAFAQGLGLGCPDRFRDLPHGSHHPAARGVPARVVMEELGRSQIALTLDTYSHAIPALMRDAADEVDRALGSAL